MNSDGIGISQVVQYFFNYNSQVSVERSLNKIAICIASPPKAAGVHGGELFVQINGKNPTRTITDDLLGIFERDNIFTILGKKRISFVPESDRIQYAVYYRYEQQMWLIYTNPIFLSPEQQSGDTE